LAFQGQDVIADLVFLLSQGWKCLLDLEEDSPVMHLDILSGTPKVILFDVF